MSITIPHREKCPHCGVSLIGSAIPEEHRYMYGGETHGWRSVLVEVRGVYDGGLYYECPDCKGAWHRFTEGNSMWRKAEEYFHKHRIKHIHEDR